MKKLTSNQRIRELIDFLGISQTEFCEKSKINKSALSNYLNGDRTPRQDQISKIAEAFDVNPAWLMGYDVPRYLPSDNDVPDQLQMENGSYFKCPIKYLELVLAAEGCSDKDLDFVIRILSASKNYDPLKHQLQSIKKGIVHTSRKKEAGQSHSRNYKHAVVTSKPKVAATPIIAADVENIINKAQIQKSIAPRIHKTRIKKS